MSGDLDAWLNDGVGDDVAKARGDPQGPSQPPVNPATKPSLKNMGINRGGVIRNPTTKKVTMLNNPVNNPKPSKIGMTQGPTANVPSPEEELIAEHPALAIPSIMTGMDMDTAKPKNGTEPPPPEPKPKQVQTGQPMPVTYDSTLRDLLMLAYNSGGILHFGTGEFVLSIQLITPAASKSRE